jgi:hypothetical protein
VGDMDLKDFHKEFDIFLNFIKSKEHFAFSRFSDGELYMMQNRAYKIEKDKVLLREQVHKGQWGEEELKEFVPEEQQMHREKLIETFEFVKEKYFKGISCKCCIGEQDWQWQHKYVSENIQLTWANLLINGNYTRFIEEMVPEFTNYPVVYVCNKAANVQKLPFNVKKTFRIGNNCHVNDYHLVEDIKNWTKENKVKGHLFLFSAATLTNYMIYELFKDFDQNTYLDIGSTLNPLMDMTGWVASRAYLRGYWMKENNQYINMKCVW